jgi:sRNA-binding regulator protein Hfq
MSDELEIKPGAIQFLPKYEPMQVIEDRYGRKQAIRKSAIMTVEPMSQQDDFRQEVTLALVTGVRVQACGETFEQWVEKLNRD